MELDKEQQKTYLETIKVRFERSENGSIKWVPDANGPWSIIDSRTKSGLIKFFEPAHTIGFDPYGQPLTPEQTPIQ